MSKVTPSALRGLSVAAGTVSLAAVGAAAAGPAVAATGLPGLGAGGGGLPLSTNALSAVTTLVAHNPGQIAGVPIASLPGVNQLPQVMADASPGLQYVPGLAGSVADGPQTRSRATDYSHPSLAHSASHAIAAPWAPPAAPVAVPPPAVPPMPQMPPMPQNPPMPQAPPPATAPPAKADGPLEKVTDALPVKSLPVVGGLAGNLPGLGGLGGLGGLTHF
ncbi:MAG: hypothetical protein HOW97_34375 [Catenulispora sp.]|nr:hypothetical protein [Catenulispora sp.]